MHWGWYWLNFAAHISWFAFIVYLFNVHGVPHLSFDTLSFSVTALEVVLVVLGLLGFGYFKYVAEKQAEDVARETVEATVSTNLPGLVAKAVRFHIQGNVTDEEADSISKAVDEVSPDGK